MADFKSFILLLQVHTLKGTHKLEPRKFSATCRIIYWKSIPQVLVPLPQLLCCCCLNGHEFTSSNWQKHASCCRPCQPMAFRDGPFFSGGMWNGLSSCHRSWLRHGKEQWQQVRAWASSRSSLEWPHCPAEALSESLWAVAIAWPSPGLCMSLGSYFHSGLPHCNKGLPMLSGRRKLDVCISSDTSSKCHFCETTWNIRRGQVDTSVPQHPPSVRSSVLACINC